jgi:hypothetical protein
VKKENKVVPINNTAKLENTLFQENGFSFHDRTRNSHIMTRIIKSIGNAVSEMRWV